LVIAVVGVLSGPLRTWEGSYTPHFLYIISHIPSGSLGIPKDP